MKWKMTGLGTVWRSRWTYGYTDPESYVAVCQRWVFMLGRFTLWKKWVKVGEISISEYCARTCVGDHPLTPEQFERFSRHNV